MLTKGWRREGGHEGPYEEPASLALKTKNERLMNGNLYKIRASPREYFVLDDLAGEVIRACPKLLMNKTKINHAWALSIYKFQGSEAEVKTLVGHRWKLNFSFHSCDNICSLRKWVRELAPRLHSSDSRQEEGGDGWELPAAEDGDHEDADHEADIVGAEGEEDVGRPYCQEGNRGEGFGC